MDRRQFKSSQNNSQFNILKRFQAQQNILNLTFNIQFLSLNLDIEYNFIVIPMFIGPLISNGRWFLEIGEMIDGGRWEVRCVSLPAVIRICQFAIEEMTLIVVPLPESYHGCCSPLDVRAWRSSPHSPSSLSTQDTDRSSSSAHVVFTYYSCIVLNNFVNICVININLLNN